MRRLPAFVDGNLDFDFICREWLKNGDIGDNFVASIPLFEINEYVVTLKQNRELYPTLDAIYGEHIGTIGGYFYFDSDIAFTALYSRGNLVLRLNKKHSELIDEINTNIIRVKKSGVLKIIRQCLYFYS